MSDSKPETTKLTPMEQAMNWERMSGERLSGAERKRIMEGGEFTPPHLPRPAAHMWMYSAVTAADDVNRCWRCNMTRADAPTAGGGSQAYLPCPGGYSTHLDGESDTAGQL